jgi:uncharacterized protein YbaP (TraB family)
MPKSGVPLFISFIFLIFCNAASGQRSLKGRHSVQPLINNPIAAPCRYIEVPQRIPATSLLWRISSKEMKKPSYLFGTIHMICEADYLWTPCMKKSLGDCEEVCFEMDLDKPSLMMEVAAGMIDNSGKQLPDYFSDEDYKKIERFLADSFNMNISMFRQMKPSALEAIFATKLLSCPLPSSYENNILEEAKKQKKNISGLEEASEQLALFDSIPADSVTKDLVKMINNYSAEKAAYNKMLLAYKQQDLPLLYDMIQKSKELGDNTGAFLDERNEKWIERMVEKMDQNSVFFAVGAGHLWGDKGLITLLRNANYTVEPVR